MIENIKSIIISDNQINFLKESLTFVNKNNFKPSLVIYNSEKEFDLAKEYGANYVLKIEYNNYLDKLCWVIGTVAEIYKKYNFELVILPNTVLGFELGPRLAMKLRGSYISNVVGYEVKDNALILKKLVYSGIGIELVKPKQSPIIFTIKEGFEEPLPSPNPSVKSLEIEKYSDNKYSKGIKLVKQEEVKIVDIRNADKLVVIGRGVKNKDDIKMIKELASLIGAEIGGSRPIVTDYKWLEDYRQVGLSGITVKPKLYIGVGVSGQIHHIMGMKDSKIVVAINKDPNAPIKENSDYFVKADLYMFIPKLIKELSQMYKK
jgi:electron transfer flavoprotein alpha subunit